MNNKIISWLLEDDNPAIKYRTQTGLLAPNGRFVLSIDKNQDEYIDFNSRKIKVFPDNPDDICGYIKAVRLKLEKQVETEFAYIFVTTK